MGEVKTTYCDVCKKSDDGMGTMSRKTFQAIFLTEQVQGISCYPYLDFIEIDVCGKCMQHILKGNYLFVEGTMDHNIYFFKDKKEIIE